jgi:hypothetical protein
MPNKNNATNPTRIQSFFMMSPVLTRQGRDRLARARCPDEPNYETAEQP